METKRPDRNPASCKIQYPMKNRDKDADLNLKIKTFQKFFLFLRIENEKVVSFKHNFFICTHFGVLHLQIDFNYFFRYITSFTKRTVLATSGNAAATKLGA
jgi:hypothetical protein